MTPVRLPSVLAAALAATACYSIIGPELTLPPDAVRTDPSVEYAAWYAETELCTGVTGSFAAVRWFAVPHERWWDPVHEQYAIGTWRAPHDIYVSQHHRDSESLVKHEIVHDLLEGGLTYDPRFENCSGIAHS
jgi:hypothetical protein